MIPSQLEPLAPRLVYFSVILRRAFVILIIYHVGMMLQNQIATAQNPANLLRILFDNGRIRDYVNDTIFTSL
ncbi:hypothetical protein D3C74_313670 [compost metagenome]